MHTPGSPREIFSFRASRLATEPETKGVVEHGGDRDRQVNY
ncbi:hypothetical protein [Leptolyngbya sp. KIOST-1]|nr:hypothetical protein [Leptolyngbya sp. KIOST-1]